MLANRRHPSHLSTSVKLLLHVGRCLLQMSARSLTMSVLSSRSRPSGSSSTATWAPVTLTSFVSSLQMGYDGLGGGSLPCSLLRPELGAAVLSKSFSSLWTARRLEGPPPLPPAHTFNPRAQRLCLDFGPLTPPLSPTPANVSDANNNNFCK